MIYVSHHLEEVFRLAHRVTVLRDGELVATQPASELSQDEVVTLMAGHRITQSAVAESAARDRRSGAGARVQPPGDRRCCTTSISWCARARWSVWSALSAPAAMTWPGCCSGSTGPRAGG